MRFIFICVALTLYYITPNHQVLADEYFETACTTNEACKTTHDHSRCLKKPDDTKVCGCESSTGYFKEGTGCALHNHVHDRCFDTGSICVDPSSKCSDDGSNTDSKRCMCIHGYITVYNETNNKFHCGKELVNVAECDLCIKNEGKCYDVDADGKKDGCQCVFSRSGADCEQMHMTVNCTATEKIICYGPENVGVNFTLGSKVFTENHQDDPHCVGSLVTTNTVNPRCAVGLHQLVLPLGSEKRRCGTERVQTENGYRRLDTTVAISRHNSHDYYKFMTYCALQEQTHTTFGGVNVFPHGGDREGDTHNAEVRLGMMDRMYNDLGSTPRLHIRDRVIFYLQIANTAVYTSIKVESAMFSTKARVDLNHNSKNSQTTKQVIVNGCAVNEPMTKENMWHRVNDNPTQLETKLVPIFKFGSSSILFLHMSVVLCTDEIADQCIPTNCTAAEAEGSLRRRKRAAVDGLTDMESVQIYIEILDDKEEKKVGSISMRSFLMLIVVVIVVFLVFIAFTIFMLWKIRNKETKVMDYAPEKPQQFEMPRMERNTMRI